MFTKDELKTLRSLVFERKTEALTGYLNAIKKEDEASYEFFQNEMDDMQNLIFTIDDMLESE